MCMALEPWWRQPMPSDKANCCREGFFMTFWFWCRFKRSRACFSFQMRCEHYFNSVSTSWTAPISLYLENRHSDHLQSCIWHMGMHAQFKRHESIKPRCGAVRGETGVLWHCPAQQRLRLDLNMHLSRQCTHNRFFNSGRGIALSESFRSSCGRGKNHWRSRLSALAGYAARRWWISWPQGFDVSAFGTALLVTGYGCHACCAWHAEILRWYLDIHVISFYIISGISHAYIYKLYIYISWQDSKSSVFSVCYVDGM